MYHFYTANVVVVVVVVGFLRVCLWGGEHSTCV